MGASSLGAYPFGKLSVRFEVSQVLFRLSRWENLEYAKEI